MFTINVTKLPLDTAVPLLIQVDPGDSLSPWQKVGTITRTAEQLCVRFRAGAGHVFPVWDTCVWSDEARWGSRRSSFAHVRFGVFCAGRGVLVVAAGRLERWDLARAQASAHGRRRPRGRSVTAARARRAVRRPKGPMPMIGQVHAATKESERRCQPILN